MKLPRWHSRQDEDLEQEIRSHLDMATADHVARGESAQQARQKVQREFGNPGLIREITREMWGWTSLERLAQDVRYGVRTLGRNLTFSAMAILTLALGVGATTAIFSVVYATLLEPLPYARPEQLVMLWVQVNGQRNSVSAGDFLEWQRRSQSFQYLEAWTGSTFNVAADDRPQQIAAALMTPGFFRMTGTPMWLGRDFLPEEGQQGKDNVVVMSNRIWREHFASSQDIIGRTIRMNGAPYSVIGVAHPGMRDRQPSQLWLPLTFRPQPDPHAGGWLRVMGRLKDGVTLAQANAEMKSINLQLAQEFPRTNANRLVSVEPLQNNFIPEKTITNLWLLLGAVAFLLLIACVNIANLLLARGASRRHEVALRAALGATRVRQFRQLLTESLVLAAIGGLLGIVSSRLIIDGILAILPPNVLPSEADVRISMPVMIFTLVASVCAGLLFGCAPAWQASRLDLNEVLKQGGRVGLNRSGRGLRRGLVIVEFALALTLLAGGGLALRSFLNLSKTDLGVRTDHVLTFSLPLPRARATDLNRMTNLFGQLLEKIEEVPGIESAALTTLLPLRGSGMGWQFHVASQPVPEPNDRPRASFQIISPGFFKTFGTRLVQGRNLTEQDTAESEQVVMVNETFVKQFLSGRDPVSERLVLNRMNPVDRNPGAEVACRVIGVIADIRGGDELREEDFPAVFVPLAQNPWPTGGVGVRTSIDPALMTQTLAGIVSSVYPDVPLAGVKTMDQFVAESLAFDRFVMVLYGSFALLALLLASIGIYGVTAFGVAQRKHEFGIRMALGAGAQQIVRLVLREGVTLAIIGLTAGLAGAYFVGRALQSTLYEVATLDFGSIATVSVVLIFAALLACFIPARRATRIDPMRVLRQ